jgi:hypothetical protein
MENQLDFFQRCWHCTVPTFSINTMTSVHLEITIKSKGRVSWWNGVRLTHFKVAPWIWILGFSFYCKCFINVWVYKWLCNPWLNKQFHFAFVTFAESCREYVQWHGHLLSRSSSRVHCIII